LNLGTRIRSLHRDESGFALAIAIALVALLGIVSVSLTMVAQGEDSRAHRDQTRDGAYQAAEAGTNAFLSNLTESTAFPSAYVAKGEATRSGSGGTTHPNNCVAGSTVTTKSTCSNMTWNAAWGTTWTYTTDPLSDTGWYSLGNGYQYLIQIHPPDQSLSGLAQTLTRLDVTGRPFGSTNKSQWRTIETVMRPSSLTDFAAFTATNLAYGPDATTIGPVFVGEDRNGNAGNLIHQGTAKANLYAEGRVTTYSNTLQNGARAYDSTTTPTALCKLNNCTAVPFSNFASTFSTVAGAAGAGGISLAATDSTNSALSGQGYRVDAWDLEFQSNGTVKVASCKQYSTTDRRGRTTVFDVYDGDNAPVCGTQKTLNVPTNGAIYSAVDVLVSGVVKGKVTVATAADVVFAGDTTYNQNGVDVLGVEATGSVIVAQWAPDSNHNITIYSAEFALNGLFERDPSWGGWPSGTMNYYGSTAVYGYSPCSSSDCTVIFSDFFSKRYYNYDTNLLFVQPPYWPSLGNAFTILLQRTL
jgi:Tfp pilus assembly protein PilX